MIEGILSRKDRFESEMRGEGEKEWGNRSICRQIGAAYEEKAMDRGGVFFAV